jgi:hypothetical protein
VEDCIAAPDDQIGIELNLDQLDSLAGSVAVDANNTNDKTQIAKLARVYDKIDYLLNSHAGDKSATEPEGVRLAQFVASILVLADCYAEAGIDGPHSISRIQTVELILTKPERAAILRLTTLKDSMREKLDDAPSSDRPFQLSLNEVAVVSFAVSEALLGESSDTLTLRNVAAKAECLLVECLNENAAPSAFDAKTATTYTRKPRP